MLKIMLPIPRFFGAGEVFAGKGCLGSLRALGAARAAVIISGSILADESLLYKIKKSIGAIEIQFFQAPKGEPTLTGLEPLVRGVSEFRPDWIVAIGGGSVIDAAKLVWVFYEHPDVEADLITRPFALPSMRGKARLVAVPTTSGTGSEVSSASVFFDPESGSKKMVVSHDLLPDIVVLDPTLMLGLPKHVIASSGMDALAHAIEGYVSRFQNPMLDIQAEAAARLIFEYLPQYYEEPEALEICQQMMIAAMMAGWVQNLKVPGAGHALAHQMGRFGVSHGLACGLMLIPSIKINAKEESIKAKYEQFSVRIGLEGLDTLLERIEGLRRLIGLDKSLGRMVKDGENALLREKNAIVQDALNDPCTRANPKPLSKESFEEMLEQVI